MAEENLEQIRDDKCFPIAQAVLEGIAKNLLEDEGIKNTALGTLELTLGQDLNVSQDMTYIPQLVLGVLSGANATLQRCVTTPLDIERYKGIAKKMLVILAEAKLPMNIKADQIEAAFVGVKEKFDALFAEEKLNSLETKYVMDSIFDAFAAFNNMLSASVENSMEKATAKVLGIENTNDLTMKQLDTILRTDLLKQNPEAK